LSETTLDLLDHTGLVLKGFGKAQSIKPKIFMQKHYVFYFLTLPMVLIFFIFMRSKALGKPPKYRLSYSVPTIAGCQIFPSDNIWNAQIENLPVHDYSHAYISTIGPNSYLHPDFGSGYWPENSNSPIGIPLNIVPGNQPGVTVNFDYIEESDPGPYPLPTNPQIEGGIDSDGDRHILILEKDNCILYELFYAWPITDGFWTAVSGAIFDLKSNNLRPEGWTSADAAGLPILPGLIIYDEVLSGEVTHAIRFTAPETRNEFVWPARHYASQLTGLSYPPMGQRFRLKSSFDISDFSPEIQVILIALKKYGMILADNGSPWFLSGLPDERWDNNILNELKQIPGSAFEAVNISSLMADKNSGKTTPNNIHHIFLPLVNLIK